jgi:toxin ParE1/3/4
MPKPPDIWRVNVTRAADADIEEIHRWTEDRLGLAQADAYATAIASAVKALAAGPRVRGARRRGDFRSWLYTLHLSRFRRRARHFVLFRVSDPDGRRLDVLRILHDAMDLVRHLPSDASDEEETS